MKRVIIPTDFSITALNAAFYAFELMKEEEVKYFLVNCYQIPYTMPEIPPLGSEMIQEELKVLLQKEVDKIKRFTKYSKLHIKPVLKLGGPSACINDMVDDLSADAVFVGTTGAGGAKEVFLGTTAYDIASNVRCPVWIIPSKSDLGVPRNILFAADFKMMQNKNILKPMLNIANENESFIQILNVYNTDGDGDTEQAGIEFFSSLQKEKIEHSYKLITQKENEDLEAAILDYIAHNTTDLLVMVKRHYGFIKQIFHQSVTKDMAFHSSVPVLILHDN